MSDRRPSGLERSPTAPSVLSNGHFASIGGDGDTASYEHGVQVIDENKEFKYGHLRLDPDPPQIRLATTTITMTSRLRY
jgi:hypothetical protein